MNTIYDYPIIGGIALGIRTVIDTVKYIFKKPALLAFPLITGFIFLLFEFKYYDSIDLFKNFVSTSSGIFFGYITMLLIYSVALTSYFWIAAATSNYIEQNITQKNNVFLGKILVDTATTNFYIHRKTALLIMTVTALSFFGLSKFYPSLKVITTKNPNFEFFLVAILILSFFIGPLTGRKSLLTSNLLKRELPFIN